MKDQEVPERIKGRRPIDDALIPLLAADRTHEQAAEAVGCGSATVGRRVADPVFRQRVEDARRQMFEEATARLASVATAAVDTLAEMMTTADTDAARVSAARTVLTLALPWRAAVEVEAQVAELQRQVAEINARPNVRRLR